MEHITMLEVIAFFVVFIGILWLYFENNHKTMELEDMVTELPPPPEVNNKLNILYDMTKYRVISRVLCIVDAACTFYYPQRKTLLGWKNIKQNGEIVKFRKLSEAFRYIDGYPLATNVEQRPPRESNHLDCWVYHFTARTTKEDLSEFLKTAVESFRLSYYLGIMFIDMELDGISHVLLPVRPDDSVVLYPNGQVYVVPDVDKFPVSVLSTK